MNHHQEATTSAWLKLQVLFNCACRYRRCHCYGGIFWPALRVCGWLCKEVLLYTGCGSLMMVPTWTETCWNGFCKFNWFLTFQRFYIIECISWTIKHLISLMHGVIVKIIEAKWYCCVNLLGFTVLRYVTLCGFLRAEIVPCRLAAQPTWLHSVHDIWVPFSHRPRLTIISFQAAYFFLCLTSVFYFCKIH